MDAVKEFNSELCSLYEIQPPVTKAKMSQITKTAIKALKFYKHVVQSVEKFIQKCRQEYKVPGLYIIDSIIRCSRKQFGPDKDMFAPRFSKNIVITFHNLFDCPSEDISKMIRVLNLWQKNGVYHPGIIQPLLDLASDPHNPAVFETVQKQVEQVTGLTPSMPLKCDQKPPALTADALQLGTGLDPKSDLQGDFSKVINQLMQSMIPNPVPTLGLNPQVQLQLLQQLLQLPVPMVPSAPLLPNNMRLPSSSSVDNSLIGQIQMLTQQLLSQAAPSSSSTPFGIGAVAIDDHQKQREPLDPEHFDEVDEPGMVMMSSLDKEGDARDDSENSHKWHGEPERNRKHEHSKRSGFDEPDKNTSEAGYMSDVANHFCTPTTPEHASSLRSTPRKSINCNNGEEVEEYRRTPSSDPIGEDIQNGSGNENDSGSRSSEVDAEVSRGTKSSRNRQRNDSSSEYKSRKSRKHTEDSEVDADDRKSRRSRHKSRSDERSFNQKMSCSPILHDDRSDRARHKKRPREKHDSRGGEGKKLKEDSRRSDSAHGKDDADRDRHSSKGFGSPDKKRKRPEFTVEYGVAEDDEDDDDVIFVDIQKKSVDVSRFLEKRLPSMTQKRKRGSRSHSRSSSVEFIAQDSDQSTLGKDREFMPPIKSNMLSVCSTTLWIGHLNKLTSEEELRAELTDFGGTTIILVPPRGCAFINFASRAEAHKALNHLKNVVVQGSQLKVAWAAGVGIKNSPFYEKHDSDLGVTYISWSQLTSIDLPPLLEGSFVDEDSLPPNFNRENLILKKPRKKKTQQKQEDEMHMEMTAINPSLIPLPQAVPLPPPPLPPISSASSMPHSVNVVGSVTSVGYMPPLPPSTCYDLLSSAASSSPSISTPIGALKGLPHFDPSVPPPCFPNTFPMPGNDNVPTNTLPSRFMPPSSVLGTETVFRNVEFSSVINTPSSEATRSSADGISNIPVLVNNQLPAGDQAVMSTASSIHNPIIQEQQNPLDNSLPVLPISTAGVLHSSSLNHVLMMEKSQIKYLPQNTNFVMQGPPESQLAMPGCVLRPLGPSNNNLEHSMIKVAHLVASGLNKEQSNCSIVVGQGQLEPREIGAQQNVVIPPCPPLSVMSLSHLRPNLLQPPPSAQLAAYVNHQENSKRLPVPSEFLRRLGVTATSAQSQSSASGNSLNKQVPLLPMPSINVPPPGVQVPPVSPAGSQTRDEVVPSPTQQGGESQLQDSKISKKQPLLETPVALNEGPFTAHIHHPSQMLNLNHPAYNNLDITKKDSTSIGAMPTLRIPNAIGDRFRTPRPPKLLGLPTGDVRESRPNLPIVLNFQNMPSSNPSEVLISEAIKTLSPLVRIPSAQECMGLLRNPLVNPANFLAAPNILGPARMDLRMQFRSPGMRGPANFKVGDRRNITRPLGMNHQRPMRHWHPQN